jgi:molybdopterin-guanine dinucleotide biosynthesis protein A
VPKGLLRVEGQTVIDRLVALGAAFAETLLVGDDGGAYPHLSERRVRDVHPHLGAPGGVHAALVAARTSWVVVVACDMPFVKLAALGLLLGARGADGACFELNGRSEPLPCVLRCALAPAWEAALAGSPSFIKLFGQFEVKRLPQAMLASVDDGLGSVVSVNSAEDARCRGVQVPTSVRLP